MSACFLEQAKQLPPVAVSVVIPVFNVAPYLRRCLASVCGQTLHDMEIICINDASTDASPAILREYAAQDERVSITDLRENHGVAFARNAGIEAARGEYLGFVDPDDYVDPDFYEKLYALASEAKSDIVKGSRIIIDEYGKAVHQFINDSIRENKFKFSYQHTTAIYSRKLICENKICYPDGLSNNEDGVFLFKSTYFANKIETVDNVYYIYRRRLGSLASDRYSVSSWCSALTSFELIIDFINEVNLTIDDYKKLFCSVIRPIDYRGKLFSELGDKAAVRMYTEAVLKMYSKCKYHGTLDVCYYLQPSLHMPSKIEHEKFLAALQACEYIIGFINTHEVPPEDYCIMFCQCLSRCCNELPFRIYPEYDNLAFLVCAETAIKFYRACKHRDLLDASLGVEFPALRKYLLIGDAVRLTEYLRLHKIPARKRTADLRSRMMFIGKQQVEE
jgi:glycosyltransferase involved in cell wall biosynthesis